jgi:hypothetical protein
LFLNCRIALIRRSQLLHPHLRTLNKAKRRVLPLTLHGNFKKTRFLANIRPSPCPHQIQALSFVNLWRPHNISASNGLWMIMISVYRPVPRCMEGNVIQHPDLPDSQLLPPSLPSGRHIKQKADRCILMAFLIALLLWMNMWRRRTRYEQMYQR